MSAADRGVFASYLVRWHLEVDGEAFATRTSRLLPVRSGGRPAIIKIAHEEEERLGGLLMTWWDGDGAARVLAQDADALLLERAEGRRSLTEMARGGADDAATGILCAVAARLHAPRNTPRPTLVPLDTWFRELAPAAAAHGGILTRCAATADRLLASQRDIGPLHGDLHHDNVLDFGARGWLAIDPKRLLGERGFDFANIFTNPDLEDPSRPVAVRPERFAARLAIVAERTGIERRRLLEWILAWCGLSAAWFLGDGDPATIDLAVAALAAVELDR